MIPRVARRGSSFKGAGQYYLHDKNAQTNERVDWTLTHNIPTQDPNKALKWMSYTSMNAEKIKREHGGSMAGAKSMGKPVYAYSLSWHPEDKVTREEMEKAAFTSLEKLKLKDHEVLIVAHKDEPQPHVHIICNLVHPQTGKTKSMSVDYNHLSKWAEAHNKEYGRNHCPERVKNNAERYKNKSKPQFVKHREKEHRAELFQSLHEKHKSGKAFQEAMEQEGYTLAMGEGRGKRRKKRNRILVVDEEGNTYNLTRQLTKEDGKGLRAKDLRERLNDINLDSLPDAQAISDERITAIEADRVKLKTEQEIEPQKDHSEKPTHVDEFKKVAANDNEKKKIETEFNRAGKQNTTPKKDNVIDFEEAKKRLSKKKPPVDSLSDIIKKAKENRRKEQGKDSDFQKKFNDKVSPKKPLKKDKGKDLDLEI